MARELVILVAAVAVLALMVWLLRRAGGRSQRPEQKGVMARMHDLAEPRDDGPQRVRRADRPRPGAAGGERARDRRRAEAEATRARAAAEGEAARRREAPADHDGDDELDAGDPEARSAYKAGLAKTRGGFVAKLGKLFGRKQIEADVLGQLEEVLFTADIGPRAADRIFHAVKSNLSRDELTDPPKIRQIRKTSAAILSVDAPPVTMQGRTPFVLLVLGVNGVGKTTTIGKLAARLRREGKKVLLAAGDTFRAAATEQLEIWGQRAGCPVVKSAKPGGDPSSVIFDAVKRGVDEQFDVVICDTAGRLHTKVELMDELKKVRRVCEKAMPGTPHETWMVLDATTGQNAIAQAKTFKEAMEITGLVLTKLDGTAKGGVILGICDELKVPVRYVGVGEQVDDLRPFDPGAFVAALYDDAETAGEA